MLARCKDWLLIAILVLLPWQTRFVYQAGVLEGAYWEYGTLSLYGTELLVWLCVLLHIVDFWKYKQPIENVGRKKRVLRAVVVLVFAVVALVRSPLIEITEQRLVWLMAATCLALVVATRKNIMRYWWALWVGGVIQACVGLSQFATQQVVANKWLGQAWQSGTIAGSGSIETAAERWLRAYGSWGGPNPFGSYIAIIVVLGCLLYLQQAGWLKRLVLVGQGLLAAALVVSFSRGAWVAAMLGVSIFVYQHRRQWKECLPVVSVLVGVVFVWLVSLSSLVTTRLQGSRPLEVRSLTERQGQYGQAWQLFKMHPLVGVGPGLYTHALVTKLNVATYQPVHNTFVLMLVELGSVFALLIMYVVCRFVMLVYRYNPSSLAVLSVFVTSALFEHFYWSFFTGLLLAGVVIGLSLHRPNPQP